MARKALLRAATARAGWSAKTSTSWFAPLSVSVSVHRAGTVIPVTTVVTMLLAPAGIVNGGTLPFGSEQTIVIVIGPCEPAPAPEIVLVIVNSPRSRKATFVFTSVWAVSGPA